MPTTYLTIHFEPSSLVAAGFEGRDELEDPLDEALLALGIGEVTGGGSGVGGTNIDVEVTDDTRLLEAIDIVRKVLSDLNAPSTTSITDEHGTVYRIGN